MRNETKLYLAFATLFLGLALIFAGRAFAAADICWEPVPNAQVYWLVVTDDDNPGAELRATIEDTTVDADGVIHWTPSAANELSFRNESSVHVHLAAAGVTGARAWTAPGKEVTDFDCTLPMRLPGEPLLGDFDCDGRVSVVDSLRHMKAATGAAPLQECHP